MPLSEEELRLLEQMERALVAEDPKLASTLRGTALRRNARRRTYISAAAFVVGVAVLMAGAVTGTITGTVIGILGFVVMLGSAYVGLTSWRAQHAAPASEESASAPQPNGSRFGLTVVEGGKTKKRGPRPKGNGQSVMNRFEERWRRRRDQGQP